MNKQSSLKRKSAKEAVEASQKRLISIVSGVSALIVVMAVIAYFVWPTTPVTELKIEDLVIGTGREAKTGDTVTVAYTGWVQTNPIPVESSLDSGHPIEFVLGQGNVIAGWDQGLVGMKVGGKRKLTIPPHLGYGADGAGNGKIPPNAALIFEMELVDVKNTQATLPTGLKIEDLVIGTGAEAKAGDTLSMHYIGRLENGIEFDSSFDIGQPYEFVLGRGDVIPGWDQGIAGMKVGGKRKLSVPPDLAYGAEGAGNGVIPPNAVLIFELELMDVQRAAATLPPTSVTELKIEDLVVGSGAGAKTGDTLSVHYTGWLEDGTKFDSSLDSGQPIEFVMGQGKVIAGWEQGLLGMKVGGKRRLTIPPDLGYGANGTGDLIPPNAALIFEVELLAIK